MQDIDFERGLWAVVYLSGGKKLIGCVEVLAAGYQLATLGIVTSKSQETTPGWVTVSPAFELITTAMPYVDQAAHTEGMKRFVQVMPLDNCLHPSTVHVKVEGMHCFRDMESDDRVLHQDLIKAVMRSLQEARAQRAGISIPRLDTGAKFG